MIDHIINKVEAYCDLHKYGQAIKCIDEGLSYDPTNGWLLYKRGACLLELYRCEEAIESTQAAIRSGYEKDSCFYQLGLAYFFKNNKSEAEKCFKEALSINPNHERTLAVYGRVLFAQGKGRRGLKLVEKALTVNHNDTLVLKLAFYLYLEMRKKHQQKKLLEAYIENSSDEVAKLVITGEYEMQRKRFKEAQRTFTQAFSLDPTNKEVLSKLIELKYYTKWYFFFFKMPLVGFLVLGYYVNFTIIFYVYEVLFNKILEYFPKYAELLRVIYKYVGISIILIAIFAIYSVSVFLTCAILGNKEKKAAGISRR